MIREKRHQRILELIKQEKLVTVQDLSKQLDVSYMTITRDLEDLAAHSKIRRIRGGAVGVLEEQEIELLSPQFQDLKTTPQYEKKLAIARYAAEHLVEDGDYITIEAGSTVSLMVPFLKQTGLTILTNGLYTSMMVAPLIRSITLICSGGILIETGAFIGPQAEDFFSKFRVKKAFFGAQGLTVEDGFTDPTPLYTHLKSTMKRNTDKVIMLLDSTKIGTRSLVQVMSLAEVDTIVTDPGATQQDIQTLMSRGIDIRIAEE